ncbi:MAG: AAA family ATPase [Parcubacteria group bacterium]|jgi:dephospho-CoA kinase
MKIVIGTAGEIASGKETVARYIIKKYGGSLYRFSDSLREILTRMHLPADRSNYHKISMALREYFGQDALSRIVYNDIKKSKNKIIILDGIRRKSDTEYLKDIKGFKLIFIDAKIETRLVRLKARKEKPDDKNKSIAKFKKEHESEVEIKIRKLKKIADFVVDNNGEKTKLFQQIDQIIDRISKKKSNLV